MQTNKQSSRTQDRGSIYRQINSPAGHKTGDNIHRQTVQHDTKQETIYTDKQTIQQDTKQETTYTVQTNSLTGHKDGMGYLVI